MATHVVHLLFKLGLCFGQRIDFVFLCLEIVQRLLMSLLQGSLLLGQFANVFILTSQLLHQVFNLQQVVQTYIPTVYAQKTEVQLELEIQPGNRTNREF